MVSNHGYYEPWLLRIMVTTTVYTALYCTRILLFTVSDLPIPTRGYDPPDEPGAFENIVWPGYEKIVEGVRKEVKETLFLNADSPEDNYSQIEALIQRSL